MTTSFSEISSALRTPGVFGEFDSSRALRAPTLKFCRGLVIAQMLSTGSATALVPARIQNTAQAQLYYGFGSQAAQCAAAWFANNQQNDLWIIPVADPAGVAATKTVTLSGSATSAGILALWIAGRRFQLAWAIAASATTLATALAALINLDVNLPVTATSALGVVTLTARHVGVMGNDIDVRHSHLEGEALPAGASCAVAVGVVGTGDAVVSACWAPLGDQWYDAMVMPFVDATNLTAFEQELLRRQNAMVAIGAIGYTAKAGSLSTVATLGNTRNAIRSGILGTNSSPTPPWEAATMMAAQCLASRANDPARPKWTLPLVGMVAPQPKDRFTQSERNSLLYSGISTYTIDVDGTCRIEMDISTYKTGNGGAADTSWLNQTVPSTLDEMRYEAVNLLKLRFPRHKKGKDSGNYGGGQAICTPSDVKAELVLLADVFEERGWLEDKEAFVLGLAVEDDDNNPDRFNIVFPPNLVNGAAIFALKFQFIL